MSHTPHELAEDFPEHAERMHDLKMSDPHFDRLFDEYHTINRAIHRAETSVEPVEDMSEFEMRKTRMGLKDELYAMLCRAET
ncbi:MAG: YdcH family protein [Pseudomonadota bacterium]